MEVQKGVCAGEVGVGGVGGLHGVGWGWRCGSEGLRFVGWWRRARGYECEGGGVVLVDTRLVVRWVWKGERMGDRGGIGRALRRRGERSDQKGWRRVAL